MEVNRENLSIFLNENVQQVDQAIVLSSSTLMAIVCEHFGVPNSTSIQTMVGCSIRQLFPLAKKGRGHYKFLRLIESSSNQSVQSKERNKKAAEIKANFEELIKFSIEINEHIDKIKLELIDTKTRINTESDETKSVSNEVKADLNQKLEELELSLIDSENNFYKEMDQIRLVYERELDLIYSVC